MTHNYKDALEAFDILYELRQMQLSKIDDPWDLVISDKDAETIRHALKCKISEEEGS